MERNIKRYEAIQKEMEEMVTQARNKYLWVPEIMKLCDKWDELNNKAKEVEDENIDAENIMESGADLGNDDEVLKGNVESTNLENVDADLENVDVNKDGDELVMDDQAGDRN